MKKSLTAAFASGLVNLAVATQFSAGTDMAGLNDYFYYLANPDEGRAKHEAKSGGLYTLSADRTWSSLVIRDSFGAVPAVFDLGGHTLTLTGCDADTKPFYFGSQSESVVVISNGTVSIVYSPETYPWTSGENKYTDRRGGVWGRGNGTLVIAKDGRISSGTGADTTMALTTSFSGNRLVVRDGGVLDAPVYPWGGADTRIVFEKGAGFPRMSSYVFSGTGKSFPVNIYYESGWVSNVFEFCDEKLLQDAGVTQLTPGNNSKAGSFHCGIALRSADFDYTVEAVGFGGCKAPVLFEILDGAKLTVSSTAIWMCQAESQSGSRMNIDGAGSELTVLCANVSPFLLGTAENCSNGLVCVSNGGAVDFTASSEPVRIGYVAGADGNEIKVLSGGRFEAKSVNVGRTSNNGNLLTADGAGTVVALSGGLALASPAVGGAAHAVHVSGGAKLSVGGIIDLGSAGGSSPGSSIVLSGGAFVTNGSPTVVRGPGCGLTVSDSTFISRQLKIGTEAAAVGTEVVVSGRDAVVRSTDWGTVFTNGANVRIEVPKNGFASAPLQATGESYIQFHKGCTVTIDATGFMKGPRGVLETMLIDCERNSVYGVAVLENATVIPSEGVSLRWSADKKRLYLRRNNLGLVIGIR